MFIYPVLTWQSYTEHISVVPICHIDLVMRCGNRSIIACSIISSIDTIPIIVLCFIRLIQSHRIIHR